ncbi:FMRFamide receptor-like [Gigantopelta aegis]|uniref:FMRFamide receptor-like n=1 Tax=Gigantopelta aegis TaxID=1735272 RepID=UPI001B88AB43|nr:FMRFamide receptor-like [Gigantopelta aegis]
MAGFLGQITFLLMSLSAVSSTEPATSSNNVEKLKTILLWIHVVVQVFGIVGHVLSVVVLAERTLRSSTSLYLTMMSLFNCLFLVTSLYNDVDDVVTSDSTISESVIVTIRVTMGACSVYTTVAVTVERYVAVAYPLKAHALCTVSVKIRMLLPEPEYTAMMVTYGSASH